MKAKIVRVERDDEMIREARELESVPIESFEKMQQVLAQWAKKIGGKS